MEEFTVYDYHPLYQYHHLLMFTYKLVRSNVNDYEVVGDGTTSTFFPLLCDLLRDKLPDLGVRRACSAAAKVKGRAVPETRIASTRGVPVTVGDPWRAFSPPLRGGGGGESAPLPTNALTWREREFAFARFQAECSLSIP